MSDNKFGFLDTALGYIEKAGGVYSQVALAKKGVAQPVYAMQTTGANDPTIAVGQAAPVQASNGLVDAINGLGTKAAAVGAASEVRKMLPYLVGGMGLAITIYLLTKK